jgi:hypothetical protein
MDMKQAMDLLVYIEQHCNGEDRHVFWTGDGRLDVDAARAFAERMRDVLGSLLGDFCSVEQRCNAVILTVIATPEPVGT